MAVGLCSECHRKARLDPRGEGTACFDCAKRYSRGEPRLSFSVQARLSGFGITVRGYGSDQALAREDCIDKLNALAGFARGEHLG